MKPEPCTTTTAPGPALAGETPLTRGAPGPEGGVVVVVEEEEVLELALEAEREVAVLGGAGRVLVGSIETLLC